eukprot:CAMPEP_0197532598 /NCGR_PEP_ID=MMETSP1318-20131121/40323_1 /TAXON_ID=552666 /ORGANISM="Partenskyella glossopodia, Strain RCC365" /LENGTH=74 /DNA_ID=CAMNT_0043089219 /DNA_START=332 /DNA_END=556 /DNA_ORIENTATION=-
MDSIPHLNIELALIVFLIVLELDNNLDSAPKDVGDAVLGSLAVPLTMLPSPASSLANVSFAHRSLPSLSMTNFL